MRLGRKFWILAGLLALVFSGEQAVGRLVQYHSVRVEGDIQMLSTQLTVFEGIGRRYPTAAEGLQALVTKPVENPPRRWTQLANPTNLLDPWKRPYVYVVPSPDGLKPYGIYSLGPDGVSRSGGNDPDDLCSWAPGRFPAWEAARTKEAEVRANLKFFGILAGAGLAVLLSLSLHRSAKPG